VASADFPQVAIDNGRFTLSGYNVAETFATESPTATAADLADAPIRRRCEFAITITAKGLKSTDIDPVEEEAQIALLKGGPRLGLAFVVPPFGPLDARQQWIDGDGNVTRKRTAVRLQSVMTLPILIEVPAGNPQHPNIGASCRAKTSRSASATRTGKSSTREPAS
jgi:hypothetical protein